MKVYASDCKRKMEVCLKFSHLTLSMNFSASV